MILRNVIHPNLLRRKAPRAANPAHTKISAKPRCVKTPALAPEGTTSYNRAVNPTPKPKGFEHADAAGRRAGRIG